MNLVFAVMKSISAALDNENSSKVARSSSSHPVDPVDVWSTDVTGLRSQRVQFTCDLRPKLAASLCVPYDIYWHNAPLDLVAIYAALNESLPSDAPSTVIFRIICVHTH